MPVTFPPEDVPNGELLAGLPLPDIRGTMGTFYYFATDLSRYEEGNTEFGGILKRLVVENDVAHTELVGPPNPADPTAGAGNPDERTNARRRGSDEAGGAPGRGGRAAAGHDRLESADRSAQRHDRRSDDRARNGQDEPVGRSRLPDQLPRPAARHGAAAADEGRQRAAAVHLAGQLEAGQSAAADVGAGFAVGRSLQAARLLPDARVGGSDMAAERGPHGRSDVHGGSRQGVRRPRAGHPLAARRAQLGRARRRHRVDRPRAAHDVAADRPEAPDVRRRARGQVRRLDPEGLRARRPVRRRRGLSVSIPARRSSSSRITASIPGGRP